MPPQDQAPTAESILKDPKFRGLSREAQRNVLSRVDAEGFGKMDKNVQDSVLGQIEPLSTVEMFPAPSGGETIGPRTWKETAGRAAAYLPATAGAVGGMFGGIPGAAAGGVAGKAAEEEIRSWLFPKAPQAKTAGEELKGLGEAGAEQGALEAGGQVLAKGAKALATSTSAERAAGRPLNRMLRPSEDAFNFGGNPGVALAKQPGLPIATGKYGMRDFIAGRVTKLTAERDAIAAVYTRQGTTVDIRAPIKQAVSKALKNPTKFEEDALAKELRTIQKKFLTKKAPPGTYLQTPHGGMVRVTRVSRGFGNAPLDEAIEFRQYLDQRIGEFEPDTKNRIKSALQQMRHDVSEEIHQAAPQLADKDNQIYNLINAHEAMNRRIAHMESGTRETSAGKGGMEKVERKLHVPGTRTTPYMVGKSKAIRGATQIGSTPAKRALIRQAPRVGRATLTPPPDTDEEQ